MRARSSWSYLSLILATDVLVLVRCAPNPGLLARDLAAPRAWVADAGADAAAATLATAALWCAAAWLAIAIAATVMTRLPGLPGRLSVAVSQALVPAAIRRVVAGAAGLGVLLAPVAASARTPQPLPPTTASLPAPTWPMSAPTRSGPGPHLDEDIVTVTAGESLWQITADRLGSSASPAEVALAWPVIYALNRGVVGTDPSLIRPGQSLRIPITLDEDR